MTGVAAPALTPLQRLALALGSGMPASGSPGWTSGVSVAINELSQSGEAPSLHVYAPLPLPVHLAHLWRGWGARWRRRIVFPPCPLLLCQRPSHTCVRTRQSAGNAVALLPHSQAALAFSTVSQGAVQAPSPSGGAVELGAVGSRVSQTELPLSFFAPQLAMETSAFASAAGSHP